MRSLSESSLAYKAVVFILNNKVNWFLAKLHSIHMQKVGVKARSIYTARFLLTTIVRD